MIQKNSFHIVGVGASAGGLKPFTELLKAIPPDIGMAFILIQHLDPTKKSLLPETLTKISTLPLTEVKKETKIAKNHIYVMPSESFITVSDGMLHLTPRRKHSDPHNPIDLFLQSLAKHQGKQAIGIVLSGTGRDGTLGIQAIKEGGGKTFAQDDSAEYKDMPQNAIDSRSVDFILSPLEIAHTLFKISHNLKSNEQAPVESHSEPSMTRLLPRNDAVLAVLRRKTGMDFRAYKTTMVNRRIQRRMLLNHIKTLKEYVEFLDNNPGEVENLHKDMLIHVTSFFRENEQFKTLEKIVFPNLLKNRSSKNPIKIWVPGCATGEEAYSLAIVTAEFLGKKAPNIPVHILATDIAKDSITQAAEGIYKENIIENVSHKRLGQFFTKVNGGYKVKKSIRDRVKFLVHDVTQKPPEINFDLVSCRNLLIYLGESLQQKALLMLASSLKPGGFLLLGKSEGLGASAKLFSGVDSKQRIYLRKTGSVQVRMSTTPLSSQMANVAPQDFNHTARQQKITKLREVIDLTQEYANEIINELDVMNEELQSSNEELASSNEELQSTNEELETSQEELQTANEEMTTLNEELQTRNDAVTRALEYSDAIISTVREPLLILNNNLQVRTANQSFYNTFQVEKVETEGKLLHELGKGQWDIPALRKLLLEILPKGNYFQDFEVIHEFPSIGRKTMLLNARRLVQEGRKEALILLAIEDITEQRRIENIIRQSEDFKLLVQNASDILTIFTKDGTIKYQSPSIERILGYKPEERIGKNIFKDTIVHPDDLDEKKRLLKDLIAHPGKTIITEIRLRQRSGAFLIFEAIYQNLLNHPRIGGIIANYRDITERKKLEQRKDDFIALASHELKTPITSLKMFTQVIEERFKKIGDFQSAKLLTNMDKQLNKLTELVNELLDLSRVAGGKLEYKKEKFAIDSIVSETASNMQRVAEGHKLILNGRTGQKVIADADRIGQVLINLITNAVKYSPNAGRVVISLSADLENVTISVQDFGVGIQKGEQEKIFERFYQATDKSGNTFPGLGLGLYISAEIIKRHNGKIWVDSTPGKGSTFSFSLPIAKQEASHRRLIARNNNV